jgi:hypothetical protein
MISRMRRQPDWAARIHVFEDDIGSCPNEWTRLIAVGI